MKILMIHPHDIYSFQEPWTIRIVSLAKELSKRGHIVKIVFFPLGNHKKNYINNIEYVSFNRGISPLVLIKNILRMYKISKDYDIIHFQKCHFYSVLPAIIVAFIRFKPLHYDWDDWEEKIFYESTKHNSYSITRFLTGIIFQLFEKCLPSLVDSISVSSETLKDLALKRKATSDRIIEVSVGADLEQFNPAISGDRIRDKLKIKDSFVVMYHGQLHSCQYVNLFIEAAKIILNKNHSNIRFLVVGDGSFLSKIKEGLSNKKFQEKIIFTGYVPHEEIPFYIATADVCVATFEDNDITKSKSPLKVVEYLASGKMIVASDVCEVRKMVKESGLLVEPNNSEKIAQAIIKIMNNREIIQNYGKRARERAEQKYNWENSAKNLEKIYNLIFSFYNNESN